MYACICAAVTGDRIAALAAEGARSTKEVAQRCGAGAVCGQCRNRIRGMLTAQAQDIHRRGAAA
jgi:bacterioferritin-associated ferredoxin